LLAGRRLHASLHRHIAQGLAEGRSANAAFYRSRAAQYDSACPSSTLIHGEIARVPEKPAQGDHRHNSFRYFAAPTA